MSFVKFLIPVLFFLLSCKAAYQTEPLPESAFGKTWTLVTMDAPAAIALTANQEVPTLKLELDAKRVTGSTGCNAYYGNISTLQDEYRLTNISTTDNRCEPSVLAMEEFFLSKMKSIAGWNLNGKQLVLTAGDGTSLTFE